MINECPNKEEHNNPAFPDTCSLCKDEIQEDTTSMEEKLVELDPEFEMRNEILNKESGMN